MEVLLAALAFAGIRHGEGPGRWHPVFQRYRRRKLSLEASKLEQELHNAHANSLNAVRLDDLRLKDGQVHAKVHGSSRWRHFLPEQVVRIAGSHPEHPSTHLASQYRASPAHIGQLV